MNNSREHFAPLAFCTSSFALSLHLHFHSHVISQYFLIVTCADAVAVVVAVIYFCSRWFFLIKWQHCLPFIYDAQWRLEKMRDGCLSLYDIVFFLLLPCVSHVSWCSPRNFIVTLCKIYSQFPAMVFFLMLTRIV